LTFLEVTLINNKEKLILDWYKKPTFSRRTLNFLSHHPISQKRGTITNMIDRIFIGISKIP